MKKGSPEILRNTTLLHQKFNVSFDKFEELARFLLKRTLSELYAHLLHYY